MRLILRVFRNISLLGGIKSGRNMLLWKVRPRPLSPVPFPPTELSYVSSPLLRLSATFSGLFTVLQQPRLQRMLTLGYDSFWSFSGSGYAGVVTYSRHGLTKSFTPTPFPLPPSSNPLTQGRCMLTDHGTFLLLNIYAPNAGRGPSHLQQKLAFYEELSSAVGRWNLEGRKVLVTGDINTAHTELDIYNPRKYMLGTGFLDVEREWVGFFLGDRVCVDVWREFHPGVRKYTFWDQKRCTARLPHGWRLILVLREKNCGWRIDVFYANEAMMKDILSSDIHNNVSLLSHDTPTDTR